MKTNNTLLLLILIFSLCFFTSLSFAEDDPSQNPNSVENLKNFFPSANENTTVPVVPEQPEEIVPEPQPAQPIPPPPVVPADDNNSVGNGSMINMNNYNNNYNANPEDFQPLND
ncbi:MAG: hypothetical protein HQK49_00635 [Oligoflexia bacterium]|nr:hypothetical protein [Oligoflexia bacterium]